MLVLIDIETNIMYERLNFLLLAFRLATFEVIEDIKVLSGSKQVKKYVMLWANAHKLTHFISFFEEVCVVALCLSV